MRVRRRAADTRVLTITDERWTALAETLQVARPVLEAVARVESGGSGFVDSTPPKPKVLFEGHYFHRLTGGRFSATHPTLSFANWTRQHYAKSALGEWARLDSAIALDRDAALQSASWGAFQIMGANYAQCGYSDVETFVAAQYAGAPAQLECFTRFIARPWYLEPLRAKDWALFAERYNGPGYRTNKYDTKLAQAYATCARAVDEADRPARARARVPRSVPGRVQAATTVPLGRPETAPVPVARRAPVQRVVRADALDLRDWTYRPGVGDAPAPLLLPRLFRPVTDQGRTSACTGFALATVIEYLLDRAGRPVEPISGHMLYDMARRYDEWAENDEQDQGSSLRGALRGWYHHGASATALWSGSTMPAATLETGDWWLDAVTRPLGAYYRVQAGMITDIHGALSEAGVLFASALTHAGWNALHRADAVPVPTRPEDFPAIEARTGQPDAGHAFAVVGYTAQGLVIHNSWGEGWGAGGFAILTYADWRENAMDCWVAQLGVVTDEHHAVAAAPTLRVDPETLRVELSSNRQLAAHEIAPFVVDVDAEGQLSSRGRFRTNTDDLTLLVDEHLPRACSRWGCPSGVDVAIVAHDGLAGDDGSLDRALQWVPLLYSHRVLPVFLSWQTDAAGAVRNLLEAKVENDDEALRPVPWRAVTPAALLEWHDERIEGRVRRPGRALWREVKAHGREVATADGAGILALLELLRARARRKTYPSVRIHLIGHSAGALVHTHLVPRVVKMGLRLATVNLLAPAVGVQHFADVAGLALEAGATPLLVAYLTDAAERSDATCAPYGHSLLYMVSRVLEEEPDTPMLGLERHVVPAVLQHGWGAQVTRLASPGGRTPQEMRFTTATTHGGLPEDPAVMQAVVHHMLSGGQ